MVTSERRRLPAIRRAREYHLYGYDGRRYLDLFQDEGRAFLGHRIAGLSTRIKNEISKGVLFSAPSPLETRLRKRLERRYPGYRVVALQPRHMVLGMVATRQGLQAQESALHDPAVAESPFVASASASASAGTAAWDRPFLDTPDADLILPILPIPGALDCQSLMLRSEDMVELLGDPPAPYVLRACETALGHLEKVEAQISSERPLASHSTAAVDSELYAPWDEALQGLWKRRGPYLRFAGVKTHYDTVFERYLSAGYLVNPSYAGPSIVPRMYTEGERSEFAAVTAQLTREGYAGR